jgi:hypothetical protein
LLKGKASFARTDYMVTVSKFWNVLGSNQSPQYHCTMENHWYLIDEIKDVMTSENFLLGQKNDPNIVIQQEDERPYKCTITSIEQYLFCISAKNPDTFYIKLEDNIICPIETAYVFLNNFTLRKTKYKIMEFGESITQVTDKSPNVQFLMDYITRDGFSEDRWWKLRNHIVSMISRHVAVMIHARVLTFSKRIISTELLLESYRAGLFPYGWVYGTKENTLFCLNPYH